MRFDMTPQMRMLQQMKLAPRMIQSMEILQLPLLALEERLREEAEQNETIDLGVSTIETTTTDLEAQLGESATGPERDGNLTEGPSEHEVAALSQYYEEAGENYTPMHQVSRAVGSELADKKQDAMLNMADRPISLEEHLLDQLRLRFEKDPPLVTQFVEHLIANLKRTGLINGTLDDLRESFGQPITVEQALDGLDILQSMDPTGVGARDLQECLLLQLDEADPDQIDHLAVLRVLVADHLDDLEHNRLPQISKKTNLTIDEILQARDQLRHFSLAPGAAFAANDTQFVVPDIRIEPDADREGEWQVILNNQHIPRIAINRQYQKMLESKSLDTKTLEYIKRKITAANWLKESIEQRQNTLEKVTKVIISYQKGFLERGPEALLPLKMQQVADQVGVHVTTVSRAVDDKWVQTPRGIYPLKSFFSGGATTATGEEVSWEIIRCKLLDIVAQEDKSNPFSDDDLVKQLAEQGYPLARRTVTKYRQQLDIPSSRQRKSHKTDGL